MIVFFDCDLLILNVLYNPFETDKAWMMNIWGCLKIKLDLYRCCWIFLPDFAEKMVDFDFDFGLAFLV